MIFQGVFGFMLMGLMSLRLHSIRVCLCLMMGFWRMLLGCGRSCLRLGLMRWNNFAVVVVVVICRFFFAVIVPLRLSYLSVIIQKCFIEKSYE